MINRSKHTRNFSHVSHVKRISLQIASGVHTVRSNKAGDPIDIDTFISLEETAVNDRPFRLTHEDTPFHDININCYTQDVLYGNGVLQDQLISTNGMVWFGDGDLKHIWFKNKTPGSNAKIVATGTRKVE